MKKRKTLEEREIERVLYRLSDGAWLSTQESVPHLACLINQVEKCRQAIAVEIRRRLGIAEPNTSEHSQEGCHV